MTVLEDGLPKRSDYRRFRIKTLDGQDDFAAMEEVDLALPESFLPRLPIPMEAAFLAAKALRALTS